MRSNLIRYCVFTAMVWLGGASVAAAAGGTFARGCAARDMQVMLMIDTSSVSTQKMNDAMRALMHARIVCFDGYVMDALALYDDIAQSVSSDFMLSGPGR
jgi:hypothetical protein